MNTNLVLSVSPLVKTEFGVGFWDGMHRELRLTFGVHVSPRPQQMRPASEIEANLFYSIRHEVRRRLLADYDSGTRERRYIGD